MTAFSIAIALKVTLWAALISVAALAVPSNLPRVRRRLALLGMWGLWLVPWLPVPAHSSSSSLSVPAVLTPSFSGLLPVLAAVWALGSLFLLLRMVRDLTGITRLVRAAQASSLALISPVEIRFTSEIEGPCLAGWLRPCVLLPLSAASWPEGTLRAALRHECQHARQMDGLHRLCAALIRAVFWWNPAMHLLCAVYEAESEVCCDAEAATVCSRREYGEMLLAHATRMPQPAFALAFARRSGLRVRIQRLFETRRASPWLLSARWLAALAFIISAAVLMASVRVLPPSLAQKILLKEEAQLRLLADPFPGAP